MKARLLDTGGAALPGSPTPISTGDEKPKWAKVIKASGVRP